MLERALFFNAVTKAGAQSENYPFCTIDPNVGVVPVPDSRLDVLQDMYNAKEIIPTSINFL